MSSKVKMRPVTTAQSMRRSYNKIIDGDDNDPYQSMYSQAFGGRTKPSESKKDLNRMESINYQK
jgi:hypothetical protein